MNRSLSFSMLIILALQLMGCAFVPKEEAGFSRYVNPFIGTAPLTGPAHIGYTPPEGWRVWAGLTYPGSSLPNAMVQLSPITQFGSGAGYEYEDTEIIGFTHTNKGHWNLCNIPILPISPDATAPFKSTFSHEKESASPGFYEVYLEDYNVQVRLTSTLRAGVHEYTFENNQERTILFDLAKANNGVSDWEITNPTANTLQGFQRVGRDKVHFYVELSQDVETMEVIQEGSKEGYAKIALANGNDAPVLLKIGLSYVSEANAKANLKQEVADKSFEEVRWAAAKTWDKLLGHIKVKGGSEKEKTLFYTSLYRSFQWPALRSDVNGQFLDERGKTRTEDFRYYTLPSLWDTYRNKVVLLGIMQPEVTADVIQSLVEKGSHSGFIPTFFHGDHAAPFITGAYRRGVTDFEVEKAYEYLLNNAYKEGGTRPHIKEYIEKGYIADPDVENPHVETKAKAGVSKTLEFAYDDYSLAQFAKVMGDEEHYQDLIKRGQNYRNVFDPSVNFMRGRLENGDWISPFNPEYPYYEYMYREANAWQLSFYVPHDMPGLVDIYGGAEQFEKKLDTLFTKPWNPEYIARNVSGFMGQYCQGNQPDHEAPFSYYFVNKPEKSQAVIDKLLADYYGIGEHGLALSGMDDAGEMSSWYAWAAMGLYPLSPADPEYLVTVPVFDEVEWTLPTGKSVVIQNPSGGRDLKGIEVDEKKIDGYFVPHEVLEKGGTITLTTE
ncbi:glycoside hydrolase family 92 protein [Echinicola strongylocentroti]|uniref:Glycoside hydrolase family 92 protein n=1 Tax=Echinicola strongylocentroti TaxID=1795355 RepID=A0A2Z4IDZ5_9BACT|nr:GH92 family glycosyl hydrolase [Echinicola strongylocentroti]AWW29282.1 glycoside hydrolase family 92 protein [Echinicola strongylocentroti]